MKAGAIQPDLDIFARVQDGAPGELLVIGGIAVCSETGLDEGTLVFG